MSSSRNNDEESSLTIDAPDILRLIQAHLLESGLVQAAAALREESGVKSVGVLRREWNSLASRGAWGEILSQLSTLEETPPTVLSNVYEMAILELAELGDVGLAHAMLRSVTNQLDAVDAAAETQNTLPRSRVLNQRLAALQAMQSSNKPGLPHDYYDSNQGKSTKVERRKQVGRELMESIPQVPPLRLTSLLQQAVKWQSWTGQLAVTRREEEDGETKKRKRKFDLVLGESSITAAMKTGDATREDLAEPIPTKKFSSISFGKKATAEVAVFLPDGSGLVTGSSDGLIEIWSATSRYKGLRMDLPYQQKEELLGHDDTIITAMTVSHDGTMLATGDATGLVKVWKIDNGVCLRDIPAHPNSSISCLDYSHDATHILTSSQDGVCREYGLRTQKMLKEFRGHSSFVNTCKYMHGGEMLRVVTGSADGTARIWDGKSSQILHVLRPMSLGRDLTETGTSIVQKLAEDSPHDACPNLHTTIPLHTPVDSIVLVPRGQRAFLVSVLTGVVLQTFEAVTGSVFVAATVSPSNHWLYTVTEKGALQVFDVTTGEEVSVISNFGAETTKSSTDVPPELSSLVHHPHKGILGAFSTNKSQKKGLLGLWK